MTHLSSSLRPEYSRIAILERADARAAAAEQKRIELRCAEEKEAIRFESELNRLAVENSRTQGEALIAEFEKKLNSLSSELHKQLLVMSKKVSITEAMFKLLREEVERKWHSEGQRLIETWGIDVEIGKQIMNSIYAANLGCRGSLKVVKCSDNKSGFLGFDRPLGISKK